MKLLGNLLLFAKKVSISVRRRMMMGLFKEHGQGFVFFPDDTFSYHTITVGNNVYIGPGACFSALKGIQIGDNVMFGPNVSIMGGDHNTELCGKPMIENHAKRREDDSPVVIENDVWIGAGAIILKGVTVGRGAVVAAGSVVTHDVAVYSVVAGCPARWLRNRGTAEEIRSHEETCYTADRRLKIWISQTTPSMDKAPANDSAMQVLLVGKVPPPAGGVGVHVHRLLTSLQNHEFDVSFFDMRKQSMFGLPLLIMRSQLVHLHVSNSYVRVAMILLSRAMARKVLFTFHGNVGRYNKIRNFFDRISFRIATHSIVLNDQSLTLASKSTKCCSKVSKVSAYISPKKLCP